MKKKNKKYEIKLCICTKKKRTNCKKFVNLFVWIFDDIGMYLNYYIWDKNLQ